MRLWRYMDCEIRITEDAIHGISTWLESTGINEGSRAKFVNSTSYSLFRADAFDLFIDRNRRHFAVVLVLCDFTTQEDLLERARKKRTRSR